MRRQIGKIFIQVAILNLLWTLTGLMTIRSGQDRTPSPKVQTHAVLVENASPTW